MNARLACSVICVVAAALLGSCHDDKSSGNHDGALLDGASGDGQHQQVDGTVDAPLDGPGTDARAADGSQSDGALADHRVGEGLIPDIVREGGIGWGDFFWPGDARGVHLALCGGKLYACSDGLDNDQDGLADALDPECTGPCDNDEGSFELSIPGVNKDPCKQDCYWDYNSGDGNDHCDWNHKCDTESPGAQYGCPYDSAFDKCTTTQAQTCIDTCRPITPNGCDCFGCCEVYVGGHKYAKPVFLGSGSDCTAATPENCATCTQQPGCLNTCKPCELCLGKKLSDLPAYCFSSRPDAGPSDARPSDLPTRDGTTPHDQGPSPDRGVIPLPWCDPFVTPCLTNYDCPASYYCITGCCLIIVS